MGGKNVWIQDMKNVSGHFCNFITQQTNWDFCCLFYFWFFGLQSVFLSSHQCECSNPLVQNCQKLPCQGHSLCSGWTDTVRNLHPVPGQGAGRRDPHLRDVYVTWGVRFHYLHIAGSTGAHSDLEHPPLSQEGCARGEPTLLGGDVHDPCCWEV